eukprot:2096186-Amphidinium_carterae.1
MSMRVQKNARNHNKKTPRPGTTGSRIVKVSAELFRMTISFMLLIPNLFYRRLWGDESFYTEPSYVLGSPVENEKKTQSRFVRPAKREFDSVKLELLRSIRHKGKDSVEAGCIC